MGMGHLARSLAKLCVRSRGECKVNITKQFNSHVNQARWLKLNLKAAMAGDSDCWSTATMDCDCDCDIGMVEHDG